MLCKIKIKYKNNKNKTNKLKVIKKPLKLKETFKSKEKQNF